MFDLKNDINGNAINLGNETVVSAKLMMYANWFDSHEVNYYLNFFKSNDWGESMNGYVYFAGDVFEATQRELITSFLLQDNQNTHDWITWDMEIGQANPSDLQDAYDYLAMTDGIVSFEITTEAGYNFANFMSREDIYAPKLVLETAPISTPVPEPSSIVLGLMSLGGLAARRRK